MLSTALRNRQYPFSKCRLCKVLKGFFLVAQIRMLRRLLGLANFFFICKVKVELIQHPKILVLGQGIKNPVWPSGLENVSTDSLEFTMGKNLMGFLLIKSKSLSRRYCTPEKQHKCFQCTNFHESGIVMKRKE